MSGLSLLRDRKKSQQIASSAGKAKVDFSIVWKSSFKKDVSGMVVAKESFLQRSYWDKRLEYKKKNPKKQKSIDVDQWKNRVLRGL